jgi:hypothetical protein
VGQQWDKQWDKLEGLILLGFSPFLGALSHLSHYFLIFEKKTELYFMSQNRALLRG